MLVLIACALAAVVAIVVLLGWIHVAGDREGALVDEEPTLNTRNDRP